MKVFTVISIVAALACGAGCGKKDAGEKPAQQVNTDVLIRCHFVGTASLANNTNAARLKDLWSLPETQHLVEQTLQKLAHAPRTFHGDQITAAQDERGAALLRPLLDDLLRHESFLQVRGTADKTAEWTLLAQLPAERLKIWQTNLKELMQLWNLGVPATNTLEGFAGWEVKRTVAPARVRCVEAGQWLALGIGGNDLAAVAEAARRIRTGGRPIAVASNYWLQSELNLPRLSAALDLPPAIPWPRAQLTVVAQGEYLRSNMRMIFPEAMTGPLEPWLVPTNIINDPLTSFTAARGVSPWLKNCGTLQELGLTPVPNELYFWAQAQVAFQSFAAFPLQDAANKLERAGGWAPSLLGTNWQNRGLAQIGWQTNLNEVLWRSLPFITPYLRPTNFQGTEFVMGGLFPAVPRALPPPAELLSQLDANPKLIFYDWEITQARLSSWHILSQLFAIIADKPQLTTNTAALPWVLTVGSRLGNTITEITADSPKEWSLTRKSHIGFTGVELVALARWLESTNFPRLSFDLPYTHPPRSAGKLPRPAVDTPLPQNPPAKTP